MANKKKSKKKRIVIGVVVAVAVAAAGIFGYSGVRRSQAAADAAAKTSEVKSALVSTGTITDTVTGSGTLANDDAEDITVPTGITIDEVLVEEGDTVKSGQALATVNKASVESAISDIQDSISSIDEQLSDLDEDSTSETVEAAVSGRVKAIYAAQDDDVEDVMKDHESLMLISADGLMAVDLTNTGTASTGDEVRVTLPDGTEVDGTVASAAGDTVTVTLSDDGTNVGDTVSVKAASGGAALGSGTLYIHQELKVTASSGTVNEIYVTENEKVDQGDDLLSLENVKDDTSKDELLAERSDLTDALGEMLELEETGEILSDYDGTIQSVNLEDDTEVTKTSSSSTSSSSGTSGTSASAVSASGFSMSAYDTADAADVRGASGSGYTSDLIWRAGTSVAVSSPSAAGTTGFKLMSADVSAEEQAVGAESEAKSAAAAAEDSSADQQGSSSENSGSGSEASAETQTGTTTGTTTGTEASTEAQTETTGGTITTVDIPVAVPSDGDVVPTSEELLKTLEKAYEGTGYTVKSAAWNTTDQRFSSGSDRSTQSGQNAQNSKSTGTAQNIYVLKLVLSARDGYAFGAVTVRNQDGTAVTYSSFSEDGKTLSLEISYPVTAASSGSSAESGTTPTPTVTPTPTAGAGSSSSLSGLAGGNSASLSGSTSSLSGLGSSSGSTTISSDSASTELYSSYETVGFTVTTDEYMKVSISVDELDILSVSEGEEASVELDAIDGETFTGTVDSIDTTGSNSGGSSKFTVVVKVPKDDRMLVGMSATATITISSAENVLTIPVEAVAERGSEKYVYTSEDEDGNLSGETAIETGASNDAIVEVTSGLTEGQTIYYEELTGTTIENDDTQSFPFANIGGGNGGNGGGGGDMPSGGGPGGGGPGGN